MRLLGTSSTIWFADKESPRHLQDDMPNLPRQVNHAGATLFCSVQLVKGVESEVAAILPGPFHQLAGEAAHPKAQHTTQQNMEQDANPIKTGAVAVQ
jgi:hypothetical protein